jgi:peptidoglycan hydrolase-like protein with peptidoglycan-binding domain
VLLRGNSHFATVFTSLKSSLYTPDKKLYLSQELRVNDYYYLSMGDITIVPYSIDWPRDSFAGQWSLTINSENATLEESIEIHWTDLAQFGIDTKLGSCYEKDQKVLITGNGYEPNTKHPLGIYIPDGQADIDDHPERGFLKYTLVYQELLTINEQGRFESLIPLSAFPNEQSATSDYNSTYFCIVVPVEEAPEYGGHEMFYTEPGVVCYWHEGICRFNQDLYLTDPRQEGEDVATVQQRLQNLGYIEVGPADGIFGQQTEAAVLLFQQVNQLTADGIVDEQTREVLFSEEALPRPFERELYVTDPRISGNDVIAVQQKLVNLGYTEVGKVKGYFGPMTKSAVSLFQRANQLTEDGRVDEQTWQVLFDDRAIPRSQ